MANIITIDALRQQRQARDHARLMAEYDHASGTYVHAVEHGAAILRDYRQRGGDEAASCEAVVGLAAMDQCRAIADRFRAARKALVDAGLPLNEPDIEIVDADEAVAP